MNSRLYFSVFLLFILAVATFAQEKINIGILDLQAQGVSQTEAVSLTNRIRNELYLTDRFTIVERERIDAVLAEQGIQQSGCTSSECIIQLGQILNVQLMIAGSVDRLENLYTIHLRMIDVETGQIVSVASVDQEGTIKDVALRSSDEVVRYLMSEYDRGTGETEVAYKPRKIKPVSSRDYRDKKWRFGLLIGMTPNSKIGIEQEDFINNVENTILSEYNEPCFGLSVLWGFSENFALELQNLIIIRRQHFYGELVDGTGFHGRAYTVQLELPLLLRWTFLDTKVLKTHIFSGPGFMFELNGQSDYVLIDPITQEVEIMGGDLAEIMQKNVDLVIGGGLEYTFKKLTLILDLRLCFGGEDLTYRLEGPSTPVYEDLAVGRLNFDSFCVILGIYL